MLKIPILVFLVLSSLFGSGNENISSFSKAKKILKKKVYNTTNLQYAFYSNCKYDWKEWVYKSDKKRWKQVVNKKSCQYTPRTKSKRANFIEYEHIVPAHAFGHNLVCWNRGNDKCIRKNTKSYKGRKCCSKVSKKFKLMESDIYNLVPSIGELNADRSNFTFSELPGEPRAYGDVDFEVDFKARKVEPRDDVKGQIARTYFYFNKQYGLSISKKQMKLFNAWNKKYPPTKHELKINSRKKRLQGNRFIY